jgi:Protein of unknown function (DUF2934)
VAASSRRNPDSPSRRHENGSRRGRKPDHGAVARDIAQESAAIYPDTFDTPPSADEIAAEAYSIYCQRGQGEGRDLEDWLEAERRVARRMSQRQEPEMDR